MSHPCSDHPCDHCYQCDVLGICCASTVSTTVAPEATDTTLRDAINDPSSAQPDLKALIRQQAGQATSLRALIAQDAQRTQRSAQQQIPPRPLPALPAGPAPLTIRPPAQKEIPHVTARDQT